MPQLGLRNNLPITSKKIKFHAMEGLAMKRITDATSIEACNDLLFIALDFQLEIAYSQTVQMMCRSKRKTRS